MPQHSILWFCNIRAVKKQILIFDMYKLYIPCEASLWTLLHQNRKLSSRISLQNRLFCLCRLPVVIITLLFRASSKFRLIYCFFPVKSWFFIEKVHILRITHFSETTKDRNLIFGMGRDTNVKLCIQHFLSPGLSPTPLGNLYIKMWPKSPP